MSELIRCTGAHCTWRDRCAHHALPTTDTKALRWPVRVDMDCADYTARTVAWGEGEDGND